MVKASFIAHMFGHVLALLASLVNFVETEILIFHPSMDYLVLIISLILLLAGANFLVDSSVAIAQRAKISNFVIGLTIVGIGTSSPELLVSLTSSIDGHGDMAMGNVIGSNIANVLLILGITAIILPFSITRSSLRRDIPMSIFAAILLFLLSYDTILPRITENTLSRLDGFMLLVIFAVYMYLVLKSDKANPQQEEPSQSRLSGKSPWILYPVAAVSLAGLIYGGTLFVDSASALALKWGVPEAVISITLVAVGTSLPELITCIVAAFKGNAQLALGNAIGSNVFNVFMILGLSALVRPIVIEHINLLDFAVLVISAVLTFLVAFTFGKRRFDRIEGILFVLIYIAYISILLYTR